MGPDMTMKIIDESKVYDEQGKKEGNNERKKVEKIEKLEIERKLEVAPPLVCVTKKSMVILAADRIILCERRESGTTSNCVICQGVTKEMFDRCKNKWTEY